MTELFSATSKLCEDNNPEAAAFRLTFFCINMLYDRLGYNDKDDNTKLSVKYNC